MAYNLVTTAGTALATIADGTTNTTSSSLTLIGKNFAGYGAFLNENFVKLLENFSNSSAPANPIEGQLWWNNATKILQVRSGSGTSGIWKTVSSSSTGPTTNPPSNPVVGDLWWDTTLSQLKVYPGGVGATWVTVGPAFSVATGQSGALAETITDSQPSPVDHTVIKFYIANTLVGIFSKDLTFTPNPSIPGFSTIKPGLNLSSANSPSLNYWGDANNALNLGGISASNYLRSDTSGTLNGTLTISQNTALVAGATGQITLGVAAGAVQFVNTATGTNTEMYTTVSGVKTRVLTLSGADGSVTVAADPTTNLGVATKAYVDNQLSGSITSVVLRRDGTNSITGDLLPDTNNTRSIGSVSLKLKSVYATTFYGTAVTAQYADLAERFESDNIYQPGTVVELGGAKEITQAMDDLSENVFGVISTNAAFLMNGGAGDNLTHPPVAVQGRVPVRVIGKIKKGDRLVSAGNGMARAGAKTEITPWNVIGRALTSKSDTGIGEVEAIVKLNS